jgi:hypothetical protein
LGHGYIYFPAVHVNNLDLIVQEHSGMQGTGAGQLPTLVTPGMHSQLTASNPHHTVSATYGNTSVGEFNLIPNTSMLPYSLDNNWRPFLLSGQPKCLDGLDVEAIMPYSNARTPK